MKEPVPYDTTTERVTLSDAEGTGRRIRARATCASSKGRWAWMNVEVCASRLGGEKPARIGSSRDLVAFLFGVFPTHEQHREHFMIVCLDAKNAPIGVALISVGGTAAAQVEMAQIFKPALLLPAVGIALAHNHPSDTSDPSHDDVVLTQRITRAADLLGIRVLDHIILTSTPSSYFSFLDAGMMSRD